METPENLIDAGLPWYLWEHTEIGLPNKGVYVGSASFGSVSYPQEEVETKYPGFIDAYDVLSDIGCDKVLVTCVLKFCIIYSDEYNLYRFLEKSKTLNRVETALTIGLSCEELGKLLTNEMQVVSATSLPDDFGCAS